MDGEERKRNHVLIIPIRNHFSSFELRWNLFVNLCRRLSLSASQWLTCTTTFRGRLSCLSIGLSKRTHSELIRHANLSFTVDYVNVLKVPHTSLHRRVYFSSTFRKRLKSRFSWTCGHSRKLVSMLRFVLHWALNQSTCDLWFNFAISMLEAELIQKRRCRQWACLIREPIPTSPKSKSNKVKWLQSNFFLSLGFRHKLSLSFKSLAINLAERSSGATNLPTFRQQEPVRRKVSTLNSITASEALTMARRKNCHN